jgi:hypothetical protein
MARIKRGILGPFIGSLANITGYLRLGVPVIRTKIDPADVPKVRTPKQQEVTARFRLAMTFIKPVTPFINVGFSLHRAPGQTAHNVAVSKVLSQGITGEYPELKLDFQNIPVSQGELRGAVHPEVALINPERIRFSWEVNPNDFSERRRDQVMLLAFSPEDGTAYFLKSGARRSAGEEFLDIYPEQANQTFETYISFISDNREMIADSQYTGQILVP